MSKCKLQMKEVKPPEKSYFNYLYISLLILRFIATLFPGYIHPDEFFQGGQELFFGCSGSFNVKNILLENGPYRSLGVEFWNLITPWEFQPEHALRSIFPPTLMTLFPLRIYTLMKAFVIDFDKVSPLTNLSGLEILVVPRLFLAFLSLTVDTSIQYISTIKINRQAKNNVIYDLVLSPTPEVLIFAGSWPVIIFLGRPFSNSLETIFLSLLLTSFVYNRQQVNQLGKYTSNIGGLLVIGVVCSMGVFTRFTFAFFAFPVVITILHHRGVQGIMVRDTGLRKYSVRVLSSFIWIFVSFSVTSFVIMKVDRCFYHSQYNDPSPSSIIDYVENLTPINALTYNSKARNLADHGLHPRITHLLVNMPMLFGTLALFFNVSIIRRLCYSSWKSKRQIHTERMQSNNFKIPLIAGEIDMVCRRIVIFGLLILSCAPHQEPRFLLPFIVPLTLLHACDVLRGDWKKTNIFLWVIINVLSLVFFGGMHQAGIVPSVLSLPNIIQDSYETPSSVFYYRTYMVPTFLLREIQNDLKGSSQTSEVSCLANSDKQNCIIDTVFSEDNQVSSFTNVCNDINIIDMHGTDISMLKARFNDVLDCQNNSNLLLYLISPPEAIGDICVGSKEFICDELWHSFQISTEDIPFWSGDARLFLSLMKVVLFRVQCAS